MLVVDDEPDARALVRRLLTDRAATVRAAGSAAEALALLRADPPDVLGPVTSACRTRTATA